MRDDDYVPTPPTPADGTAPLVHVVSTDGRVSLRRAPQGYRIHQPDSRARAPRTPRTPTSPSPVVIADSVPSSSEGVRVMDLSELSRLANPQRAREPSARDTSVRTPDPTKNTLPSRTSPIAQPLGTFRVVLLSATISAVMSTVVFVLAYMFLLHAGR